MSQHWYSRNGKPCHTQKTRRGTERPTNIKDARKLGLLPSVSGILRVLAKDGLTNWQIDRVIDACRGFPADSEPLTLEEYKVRVKRAAFAEVDAAVSVGTQVHVALEKYFTIGLYEGGQSLTLPSGVVVELRDLVEPAIQAVENLGVHLLASEKVLVNPTHGYAGTTDLCWEHTDGTCGIIDFKTKKTKEGESIFEPEQHAMQIAAYWQAEWGRPYDWEMPPHAMGYNIYISTTEPGRVEVVKHDDGKLRDAWLAFKHCLALWRWQNKYDPRA